MSSEAPELKPCPFCGSPKASDGGQYTNASFSGVDFIGELGSVYVWCGTCGARSRNCISVIEAANEWNRRADLPWLPVSPDEAANWIINEMGEHYAALLQNALEYRL